MTIGALSGSSGPIHAQNRLKGANDGECRGEVDSCGCTQAKQEERKMDISIAGVGKITLQELEARLSAYMNAGAPEPVLEGTHEERKAILDCVASRGDSQMRALVELYLKRLSSE